MYDYGTSATPAAVTLPFGVEIGRYGFTIENEGMDIDCSTAKFIDQEGEAHDVVCGIWTDLREMTRENWTRGTISSTAGRSQFTMVPSEHVYPWPAHRPSVRLEPLIPVIPQSQKVMLDPSRERVEKFAQGQVGKTIALELPVRTGDSTQRYRVRFIVAGWQIDEVPF